ncbi:MAG: xanthine dehydrogenase small subunit [Beijerinckiaceae bacterium]
MAESIAFLLNGLERVTLSPAPDLTILEFLRQQRRLTGTKEGCAEGDCGTCTVAIGEAQDGRLQWKAVNACIAMASQLDGKLLVTVEGLAEGAVLHPVQRAMVDNHASQCGFCTPGFVMALFARFHNGPYEDDSDIHDALAGNLCRCTGYRPIVDAARSALKGERADRFGAKEQEIVAALAGLADEPPRSASDGEGRTALPHSLAELKAALAKNPDAVLLAGGTDLGLDVTKRGKRWRSVVSLAGVGELTRIEAREDGLSIGAAATYADILPHLAPFGESVETLLRRLGSRQIRNLGTIGGNIANASPIGDTLPLLLALDARFLLDGTAGARSIAASDFFTGYRKTVLRSGEFIASIELDRLRENEGVRVDKISRRFDQDISAVCGAIFWRMEAGVLADVRIAFGGMADRPKRARSGEAALRGQPVSETAFETAAAVLSRDFSPLSDFRGSAAFRMTSAQNLMRAWAEAVAQSAPGGAI